MGARSAAVSRDGIQGEKPTSRATASRKKTAQEEPPKKLGSVRSDSVRSKFEGQGSFQNKPAQPNSPLRWPPGRRRLSNSLRRFIFQRDHGKCQFRHSESGRICGSRVRVEIDHIRPFGTGRSGFRGEPSMSLPKSQPMEGEIITDGGRNPRAGDFRGSRREGKTWAFLRSNS